MRPICRGVKYPIPNSITDEFEYFVWLIWKLNKFYCYWTLISSVCFGVISIWIERPIFALAGFCGIELFYVSIAVHEACHFGMARVLGIKCHAVVIMMTHFEIRTFFDEGRTSAPLDRMIVVSAGPLLPLLFLALLATVAIAGKAPIGVFLGLAVMSVIQILSSVPAGTNDGAIVKAYLKNNLQDFKFVLFVPIIYLSHVLVGRTLEIQGKSRGGDSDDAS